MKKPGLFIHRLVKARRTPIKIQSRVIFGVKKLNDPFHFNVILRKQ